MTTGPAVLDPAAPTRHAGRDRRPRHRWRQDAAPGPAPPRRGPLGGPRARGARRASLMLAPVRSSCSSTRSSRPRSTPTGGRSACRPTLYTDGLVELLERGSTSREALELRLDHQRLGRGAAVAVLSLLNAFALGIGRVKGRMWIVVLFLLANMLPQEALIYPLYFLAKQVGLYNTQLSVDHHLHRDPERVRHLPAVLGARHLPALGARGRGARRRRAAGRCCGASSSRSRGRRSSVLMIFFFIWTWNEFFIPLVMLIDQRDPDDARGAGLAAGRPADGRADDQRRRAAQPAPRGRSSSSSSSAR